MNIELARRLDRLTRESATRDPWDHARAFLEVRAFLEAEVEAIKAKLLSHLLPWRAEESSDASRIAEAQRRLAALGATISERCLRQGPSDAQLDLVQDVICASLACHSSAIKWSLLSHQKREAPYYDIHALYHVAELEDIHRSARMLEREGVTECFSVEARYLHAILLPIFAPLHFDRQKMEIADAMLAAWVREYSVAKSSESADTCLWVDLSAPRGPVVAQFRPDGHATRLVVVTKMRRHLERTMRTFDSGKIPGSDLVGEFRLEAHVEVLDHVRLFWDRLQATSVPRLSQRSVAQLPGAWLFLNLGDVLGGTCANPDAAVRVDAENDRGLRVVVDRPIWDRVEPGHLIGLHAEGESHLAIAYVARKMEAAGGLECYLAVEWVSRSPRPLVLSSKESALVPRNLSALYLPSQEPSARGDLMLLDDRHGGEAYDVTVCGRSFTVQPTRARHKGRGWVATEFAIR